MKTKLIDKATAKSDGYFFAQESDSPLSYGNPTCEGAGLPAFLGYFFEIKKNKWKR